jgi:predicted GNAT family N-acyltransferase
MNQGQIRVVEAAWGSKPYVGAIALRHEILRRPLGLVFDPEIFRQECDDWHIVAMHDDWVVGCMILTVKETLVKMRQVAVESSLQNRGIGARMVEFAEQISMDRGATEMVLHARDTAMSFYLKLGYSIVGDGFEEVGIPHHAMRKSLVDGI